MLKIPAKPISYGGKRDRSKVGTIVIHYTAVFGDTAENEGKYYSTVNTREAGAHLFIDRAGKIVKSIDYDRVAWSVGGNKYTDCAVTGGGSLYGIVTNENSVSIELCDIMNQYPSKAQIRAVKRAIKNIRKYCPNAKRVCRHFDVTGKYCPATMCRGMNDLVWLKFMRDIGEAK